MRRLFLIGLLLFSYTINAQVSLIAEAGGGLSYIYHKQVSSLFIPTVQPNAALVLNVPITDKIALRSGIGYSPKGYNTNNIDAYDSFKFEYLTHTSLHYISIPFLLSFRAMNTDKHSLWIDGGMNYNFFAGGHTDYEYNIYRNDNIENQAVFTHNITGRYGSGRLGATENTYDVNGLDVAVKLQLRYTWQDKYSLNVFYEHSLYDFRPNPDEINSSLKMRNAGVTFGCRLF
jgi:hypothetical protein